MPLPESMSTVESSCAVRQVAAWHRQKGDAAFRAAAIELSFKHDDESPFSTSVCLSRLGAFRLQAQLAALLLSIEIADADEILKK